ncbi:MAG: hypothetical protein KF890_04820 [Nitrospira sp.]|nr:hypothetical protein [Nitrospira sp.]
MRDVEAPADWRARGEGLAKMTTRARTIGDVLRMDSQPGEGTVITGQWSWVSTLSLA